MKQLKKFVAGILLFISVDATCQITPSLPPAPPPPPELKMPKTVTHHKVKNQKSMQAPLPPKPAVPPIPAIPPIPPKKND